MAKYARMRKWEFVWEKSENVVDFTLGNVDMEVEGTAMKSFHKLQNLGAAVVAAAILTLSSASVLQATRWTFSECDLSNFPDSYGGQGLTFRLSLNAGGAKADAIRAALAPQILNIESQFFAGQFHSWTDGVATMEKDLRNSRSFRLDLSTYRFWNERFKYDYKKRLEDKERKRDLPIW